MKRDHCSMEDARLQQPRWLPLGKDFCALKMHFHASQPPDLQVKFELRRVLDELKGEAVMHTNTYIKKCRYGWGKIFSMFGGDPNSAIVHSSKAWLSLHKSHPPSHIRCEYQVEGLATLCIIAHQAGFGRADRTRSRALELLKLLLRAVVGSAGDGDVVDALSPCELSAAARHKAEECAGGQCAHKHGCQHLHKIFSDAMVNRDSATVVAKIIVSCTRQENMRCAAAVVLFQDVISKIVIKLSENFAIIGTSDPLAVDAQLRAQKKRRLDPEWMAALLHLAIHEKKAKSIKSLCQARGEPGAHNSSRWLANETAAYQWSLWDSFENTQSLAIAFDASRVGMPREETLIIAAYDVENDRAAWFIPQVLKDDTFDMPADIDGVRAKFLATVDSEITKALLLNKQNNGRKNSTTKDIKKNEKSST